MKRKLYEVTISWQEPMHRKYRVRAISADAAARAAIERLPRGAFAAELERTVKLDGKYVELDQADYDGGDWIVEEDRGEGDFEKWEQVGPAHKSQSAAELYAATMTHAGSLRIREKDGEIWLPADKGNWYRIGGGRPA